MNYLIVLRPARLGMVTEGPTEREAAIVGQHFEYLQGQARAGKVRLFGRTTQNDERTMGLVLLAVASEEEARALMLADPAVAQRVMLAELYPFRPAMS